ncbi:uncharacterized protein F5891DRAFT_1250192, partial [Suillus fuscotomentosus]
LQVPVTVVNQPFEDKTPLLHTLAAQELIKHLEEGRIPLLRPVAPTMNEEVREMAIVQLGLEYQLASQYTSFVTIEPRREMERRRLHWTASVEGSPRQHYNAFPPSITNDAPEDYVSTSSKPGKVTDNGQCVIWSEGLNGDNITHAISPQAIASHQNGPVTPSSYEFMLRLG